MKRAPTIYKVDLSDARMEAFMPPGPSESSYAALAISCSCPSGKGPCLCGAVLE